MVDGRGVHGYVIVRFAIFVLEISVSAPFPSPDDPYEHSVVACFLRWQDPPNLVGGDLFPQDVGLRLCSR